MPKLLPSVWQIWWRYLEPRRRYHNLRTTVSTLNFNLSPVHTTDADATQLSSWVASGRRQCVRNSELVVDSLDDSEQTCQQRSPVASCVSALWTHPSVVVTQFKISCAVELLRLVTSDDMMMSLLKKLSISIKIHVVKPLWSLFCQFLNCRPNPSAVVVS